MQYSRGWYMASSCNSSGGGPKGAALREKARLQTPPGACPLYGASNMQAWVVYGNPHIAFNFWGAVKPVERCAGLLRYDDPEEHETVYVERLDPSLKRTDIGMAAMPVPATPALRRIFDEYGPQFLRELFAYSRRTVRAVDDTARQLGVRRPRHPGNNASDDEHAAYREAYGAFWEAVVPHVVLPKPLLVSVPDVDDVLEELYRV